MDQGHLRIWTKEKLPSKIQQNKGEQLSENKIGLECVLEVLSPVFIPFSSNAVLKY